MRKVIGACLLVVMLLAGCAPLVGDTTRYAPTLTEYATTATPRGTRHAPLLAPSEREVMTIAPDNRPTVEQPVLRLDIEVVDVSTHKRVDGALISIDGADLPRGCCASVAVNGTLPHTLTVAAEGYWLWSVTINPHIDHDKTLSVPVELTPKLPEG